jgi:hypothetical protein
MSVKDALDCAVYALVALIVMGPVRDSLGEWSEGLSGKVKAAKVSQRGGVGPDRSGWIGGSESISQEVEQWTRPRR